MSSSFRCDSFAKTDWHDYERALTQSLRDEIYSLPKDYLLGVDEDDCKKHLIQKYNLGLIELYEQSERILQPRIQKEPFNDYGRTVYRDLYFFRVEYQFNGCPGLFEVKPSSWTYTSHPITVFPETNVVAFEVSIVQQDPQEFRREKERAFNNSFVNVGNINADAQKWNQGLTQLVSGLFDSRKKHFSAENDFFAAINVATNPQTAEIFTVPTVTRKIIPRPEASPKQQFTRNPAMADEMYEDVLRVLFQVGQSMERKPSLYHGKDEEALRDQFLLFLETRYEATTGSSETFNKGGKTDILLKHEDGTNLFVAECKFWTGEKDFYAAIHQLFDRYLTWRDSKAALLLFVKNKDFTAVLNKVKVEAANHSYFVRVATQRAETSLAFEFHLPGDPQRLVRFAILLFAFP